MKKTALLCLLCFAFLLSACGSSSMQAAIPAPSESPEFVSTPTTVPEIEAVEPVPATVTSLPAPEEAETASEPGVYPQYRELVERVEQGLSSAWAEVAPGDLGISDVFKRTDEIELGWIQTDINGDGRDELLFGEITADDESSPIYDIFALPGEMLIHPASGWEFNRWYLLEGGWLMNEVSGTGFDLTRSAYGFFNGALVPARISADRSEYLHLSFEHFGAVSAP